MKKTVSFEKRIDFPTMIGEVCAISLEDNLKFVDESNIEGNLELIGKYKLTEASRLEEDFEYKIPIEIALTEKLDLDTASVKINDFYYEIENDDIMVCHIELCVEGLEIIDVLDDDNTNIDSSLERECDGDVKSENEIELPKIENTESTNIEEETITNNMVEEEITNNNIEVDYDEDKVNDIEITKDMTTLNSSTNESLFFNFSEENDTYGTFLVYIVRQNETINSILEKYKTTLEEVEKYNNLKEFGIGSKIIIPLTND